ncbi:meiosis 1 arrest protein [Engraulis encrasicolus]|uniref:meiosis 1 arrest protein n=1 Tax=Engraulis encrasicolus TaxID=184585 RepID=UPI002FD38E90
MTARNRAGTSAPPMPCCHPSGFSRQPPRVLVVDTSPPWWSETSLVFCEALDNFLTLASSLEGPGRLPLLSIYAVNLQQECLLPFAQVKGNLARLRLCVDELRSLPGEGCVRSRGTVLRRAILDSLQQYKQYSSHHTHTGGAGGGGGSGGSSNISLEVTVMSSQPGRALVRELEAGLRDADLGSLRRLLVVQMTTQQQRLMGGEQGWSPDTDAPLPHNLEDEEEMMLGTEVDLQVVESSVVALEGVMKAWLHEQAGEREHLHLLLPPDRTHASPICLKCDIQERLLSPCLLPDSGSRADLGHKTESLHNFQPPATAKGPPNHNAPPPQRLRVIKTLLADGVCESVLYGLPLVIRPTTCWQLDWDDMENNQQLFQALCQTLRVREWSLLVCTEPSTALGPPSASQVSPVASHYVLQPSPSLSLLLLKPMATQELLLPCTVPDANHEPPIEALLTMENSLQQLEEDPVFNPLCLSTTLYQHLRMRGLSSRPAHPYRRQNQNQAQAQAQSQFQNQAYGGGWVSPVTARQQQQQQRREPHRPPEGSMGRQQPQGRQSQQGRARATVAPLPPSSSSLGPPPAKMSRPSLTFRKPGPMATKPPASSLLAELEDDDDDDLIMML